MDISTNIENLVTVDSKYIKNISTENLILERIVNKIMIDKQVPKKVKDEIIEYAGKEWFYINDKNNNAAIWKGTENSKIEH